MKFHTAPMRLGKRGSGAFDLQAVFGAEGTDTDAELMGTFPRVKRRTSSEASESMSLWEVSQALAAATASRTSTPPHESDLGAALDDLTDLATLDALVTEELAAGAPAADELCCDDFVNSVFGDARPSTTRAPDAFALVLSEQQLALPALAGGEVTIALDGDELLAMMRHEEGPLSPTCAPYGDFRSAFLPFYEPASPSPTSVTALFGAALSGDSSPRTDDAAAVTRAAEADAFSAELARKLDSLPQTVACGHAGGSCSTGKLDSSRNGAERKEWCAEEDEIIRSSVLVHGCRWRKIAALLPGRSDDAVRNRWNRLKAEREGKEATAPRAAADGEAAPGTASAPAAKRLPSEGGAKPERVSWTRAEDATILSSVVELGHKWNKLAERLPGRTDHAIRNRYHRLQSMMEDSARRAPDAGAGGLHTPLVAPADALDAEGAISPLALSAASILQPYFAAA